MNVQIPAKTHEARPVQVQYLLTSVLVEYQPINIEKRRVKKALKRRIEAAARGNLEQARLAHIDVLAEMLTGWQHRDRKGNPIMPTRAALGRMPDGWLDAALTAVNEDFQEFLKELNH